jgi:hypothetical protein
MEVAVITDGREQRGFRVGESPSHALHHIPENSYEGNSVATVWLLQSLHLPSNEHQYTNM